MPDRFINYLFTNNTVQVLFWTLMHSLWQGIVFAFFSAIILMSTKRAATALRYKLLSSMLFLFILTSAVTFCYEVYLIKYNDTASFNKPVITLPIVAASINTQSVSIIERMISFLQVYENLIVLVWFTVIVIKCLGMFKGLRDVYILKRRRVFSAEKYWNDRLQILAESSGIKKQIRLLRSTIVKVPMVAGYFKPVILFPAAALTALAPEEIEAILLHELAHIRRKDYLINIFQRIAEIIFFFNPAVSWISSLMKEERENCCDDMAVKQTKNKKIFIHALVSFQEYNTSDYATSFSGGRKFLLNRVKRIITNKNKTISTMEKTLLAAGIIITIFAAFAFSHHRLSSFKNIPVKQPIAIAANKKDTIPQTTDKKNESIYTINTTLHGKQYKLVEVNGKVAELYIDNVRIPDNNIPEYSDIISELNKNFETAKEQTESVKAEKEALEVQQALISVNKLAIDSVSKVNIENMQAEAKKMQREMTGIKLSNDSDTVQIKLEALKGETELIQQKVLAMSASQDKISKTQLKALEAIKAQAQNKLIKQVQAEKLAALQNADNTSKIQEKLAEIKAEQEVIEVQNEKQSKEIKEKTEKIINEELKQQIQELKQQNKELDLQLHQKDSLQITPALPRGA